MGGGVECEWVGGRLSVDGLRVQESVCQFQLMKAGRFGGCWGWQCKCLPMCDSGASFLGVHSNLIVSPYKPGKPKNMTYQEDPRSLSVFR
jgi:hypothetical protein